MSAIEKRIPIRTPSGTFNVWTRQVGEHPTKKLLLLHGGPGATHELFENFEAYFSPDEIELYFYDQLGSHHSDQPDEPSLWQVGRFVDEVEQVRQALGLDANNFYLLGHSWGGILAMEYALAHQQHLKALVISNMMSSCPGYNAYAHEVLMPTMDQSVLAEIQGFEAAQDYNNDRYLDLLMEHHYVHHVLRMPADAWPDAIVRALEHINQSVYIPMQGPSELGMSGTLSNWDRSGDLHLINVPTLVIGAQHDTMDPKHMVWMAQQMPNAHSVICPDGSHLANYDDPEHFFAGLKAFVSEVDSAV